ncbi:rhodanese-like domain-containing protein [Sunxiuqinia elliptica]|uniref:Rhodanese-related sulfurtransferase n=1 Tax=Sunxiuqinia elliptica TaxID=655355 RepID=A0A4R6GMN6_9BACT|nr:rhodanese-like domain-containing protein [Sunxiuqinia elliptica]TDN96227.1 rhodanese-related sulfurtransferase [Sunxiuqinia elliptica]TDO67938.1 rhodanese-related sulfurtransferase [Sunxiuqinia elliptica]
MRPRLILASVIIPLGLIIAAVPENTTKPYKLTAEQLLNELKTDQQFVHPDQVADMLIQKDPSLQLIDVRSSAEFEKFSLPGAINVPLENLLSEDYEYYLNQDIKLNVFYSNGSTAANEAWMIARQLGYKNNYVLRGGLNFWVETIMNPQKPAETSPNEELARYDFRKAASSALGGGGAIAPVAEVDVPAAKPPIIKRKKKKSVQGGC